MSHGGIIRMINNSYNKQGLIDKYLANDSDQALLEPEDQRKFVAACDEYTMHSASKVDEVYKQNLMLICGKLSSFDFASLVAQDEAAKSLLKKLASHLRLVGGSLAEQPLFYLMGIMLNYFPVETSALLEGILFKRAHLLIGKEQYTEPLLNIIHTGLPKIRALVSRDSRMRANITTYLSSLPADRLSNYELGRFSNDALNLPPQQKDAFIKFVGMISSNPQGAVELFNQHLQTADFSRNAKEDPWLTALAASMTTNTHRAFEILARSNFCQYTHEYISEKNRDFCALLCLHSNEKLNSETALDKDILNMRLQVHMQQIVAGKHYEPILFIIAKHMDLDDDYVVSTMLEHLSNIEFKKIYKHYEKHLHNILMIAMIKNKYEILTKIHAIFDNELKIPAHKQEELAIAGIENHSKKSLVVLLIHDHFKDKMIEYLFKVYISKPSPETKEFIKSIVDYDLLAKRLRDYCKDNPKLLENNKIKSYLHLQDLDNDATMLIMDLMYELCSEDANNVLIQAILNNPEKALELNTLYCLSALKSFLLQNAEGLEQEYIVKFNKYLNLLKISPQDENTELKQLHDDCIQLYKNIPTVPLIKQFQTAVEENNLENATNLFRLHIRLLNASKSQLNFTTDPWLALCVEMVDEQKADKYLIYDIISNSRFMLNADYKSCRKKSKFVQLCAISKEEQIEWQHPSIARILHMRLMMTKYYCVLKPVSDSLIIMFNMMYQAVIANVDDTLLDIIVQQAKTSKSPSLTTEYAPLDQYITTCIKHNKPQIINSMMREVYRAHRVVMSYKQLYNHLKLGMSENKKECLEQIISFYGAKNNYDKLFATLNSVFSAENTVLICAMLNNRSISTHPDKITTLPDFVGKIKINSYNELLGLDDITARSRLEFTHKFFPQSSAAIITQVLDDKPWLAVNIDLHRSLLKMQHLLQQHANTKDATLLAHITEGLSSFPIEKLIQNEPLRQVYDKCVELLNTTSNKSNQHQTEKNLLHFYEHMHNRKEYAVIPTQSAFTDNAEHLLKFIENQDHADKKMIAIIKEEVSSGMCFGLCAAWLYQWAIPTSAIASECVWLASSKMHDFLSKLASSEVKWDELTAEDKDTINRADRLLQTMIALHGTYPKALYEDKESMKKFVTGWQTQKLENMPPALHHQRRLLYFMPLDSKGRELDTSNSTFHLPLTYLINSTDDNLLVSIRGNERGHAMAIHRVNPNEYLLYDPNGLDEHTYIATPKLMTKQNMIAFLERYCELRGYQSISLSTFKVQEPQAANKISLAN